MGETIDKIFGGSSRTTFDVSEYIIRYKWKRNVKKVMLMEPCMKK